jgi:hypothetical protein
LSRPPAAVQASQYFLGRLEAAIAGSHGSDPAPGSRRDMPAWLVQVAAVLFDGQAAATAKAWARRIHGELERLGGRVPFGVVHDWHAHTVAPMLAQACERLGGAAGPQESVRSLHARALAGERIGEAEWVAVLEPALLQVYRHAFSYAAAYATARASAHAYATANGYSADAAIEFAENYAELSTDANAQSYADANAKANAKAAAAAYAAADDQAYAESYPFAQVAAYVAAYVAAFAGQDVAAGQARRRRLAYRYLSDGLAESLARAAVRVTPDRFRLWDAGR